VTVKYNSYRVIYLFMDVPVLTRFFSLTRERAEGGRVVIDSEDKKVVKKGS